MVPRLRHRLLVEHLAAQNSLLTSDPHPRSNTLDQLGYERTALPDDQYWNDSSHISYLSPNWHANAAVREIPGFRTSAAFISSLRTNLRLHASPPPSPMSTPPSMRASTSSLPPPPSSPLTDASTTTTLAEAPPTPPEDPLADIPPLTTTSTTNPDEKVAALKLVADTVAQQRQTASRALIFHPLNLALFAVVVAVIARNMYKSPADAGLVFTTLAGTTMIALVCVRYATGAYLELAEGVGAALLDGADVYVTKFGDEVIGAVVMAWVPAEPAKGGSGKKRKAWRAEVRGWAVRIRYRGKGVGTALLADAVEEAKRKGVESVGFAEDHPNSKRILWTMYNGRMDRDDLRARNTLQAIWEDKQKSKRR